MNLNTIRKNIIFLNILFDFLVLSFNGIYKFEDLNNKYIKPTYLHLKLP